jgi:hypothetical protein
MPHAEDSSTYDGVFGQSILIERSQCLIDVNDPTGVCKTCQSVCKESKQRVYTLPCVRFKLTECTLYRTGKAPGLEFTFRWPVMKLKDITDWSNDEIRIVKIQSDICPIPLQLTVKRFNPHPRDSLKRGWMDGKTKKFKTTTPFAIINMSTALSDMKEYVDYNVFQCMDYYLRDVDPFIKETYDFARKQANRHAVSTDPICSSIY